MKDFDAALAMDFAREFAVEPSLVEKEWHAIRALEIALTLDASLGKSVFCGGTSLSAAYGLLSRFSEDVDLKLILPGRLAAPQKTECVRAFGGQLEVAMGQADYAALPERAKANDKWGYRRLGFQYTPAFKRASTIRDHIQIEITPYDGQLEPIQKDVRTAMARATNGDPDLGGVLCVQPLETAADKLSALSWRVCGRQRGAPDDDPAIIRHLYDLCMLTPQVIDDPSLRRLCLDKLRKDIHRGPKDAGSDPAFIMDGAVQAAQRLRSDKLYESEYNSFLRDMVYEKRPPSMKRALAQLDTLIARVRV